MFDPAAPKLRDGLSVLVDMPPQVLRNLRHAYGRRRKSRIATSAQDREVLEAAEQANTLTAAVARLAIAVLVASLLVGFAPRSQELYGLVAAIALANLALSVFGLLLVRWHRLRRALPSMLALADVVFILSVIATFPHRSSDLPGEFRPVLIATWGIFLALSLSTIRGTPGLLAVQTLVFAGGFFVTALTGPATTIGDPHLAQAIGFLFGTGYNAMRAVMILMTGGVLVLAALRARTNLRHAVAGSRRAASLARYLAPTVAEIVADTEVEALRRGRQQNMAVLFADVRGFTAMSEVLTPHEIAAFLNQFRACATRAIEQAGGVIDKFIGDEVMGLFGLPLESPADAANAVAAGRALLQLLQDWSRDRAKAKLPPVRVGIGVHYGPVFTGVLGDDRLEFTVLGDTVNVARRLEQAAKAVGYDLIVSAQLLDAVGHDAPSTQRWVPLAAHPIRGHQEPVAIYAEATSENAAALE